MGALICNSGEIWDILGEFSVEPCGPDDMLGIGSADGTGETSDGSTRRSASGRRASSEPCCCCRRSSSSVRSVTGDDVPVTEVVMPASLATGSGAADDDAGCASCARGVLRLRDSTRVQGPSASRTGVLLRFAAGRGTGVDDSGAVADESLCASSGTCAGLPAFFLLLLFLSLFTFWS